MRPPTHLANALSIGLTLACAALCALGVSGCGASDAHRVTMRQLEDAKIELVQVESRVILSEEQARTLRAQVVVLEKEKQALTDQNSVLANKTLTTSQASDLQTQNQIRATRQALELGLRGPLQPHVQNKTVQLTDLQGHPLITLKADDLFAPGAVVASTQHSSMLADLARALSATKGGHVIMRCRASTAASARLCTRRLNVLAGRIRELDPEVTLYPHTSQVPALPAADPSAKSKSSSTKAKSSGKVSRTTRTPKQEAGPPATLDVMVVVDLSALAGS